MDKGAAKAERGTPAPRGVAVDWQEPMVLQRKLRPSNCTR